MDINLIVVQLFSLFHNIFMAEWEKASCFTNRQVKIMHMIDLSTLVVRKIHVLVVLINFGITRFLKIYFS